MRFTPSLPPPFFAKPSNLGNGLNFVQIFYGSSTPHLFKIINCGSGTQSSRSFRTFYTNVSLKSKTHASTAGSVLYFCSFCLAEKEFNNKNELKVTYVFGTTVYTFCHYF